MELSDCKNETNGNRHKSDDDDDRTEQSHISSKKQKVALSRPQWALRFIDRRMEALEETVVAMKPQVGDVHGDILRLVAEYAGPDYDGRSRCTIL